MTLPRALGTRKGEPSAAHKSRGTPARGRWRWFALWAGCGVAVVPGTLVGGFPFLLAAIVAVTMLSRVDAGTRLDLLGIITGAGLFFFALAARCTCSRAAESSS